MADATLYRGDGAIRQTVAASVAAGEVRQMPSGLAGVKRGLLAATTGDSVPFEERGQFVMAKSAGFVALDGGLAYWDHSANAVYYKRNNDRDFVLGTFVGDAASADTTCTVNLNVFQKYVSNLAADGFQSVLVGTAASGGFGYPVPLGGATVYELTATSEAQKVDALGVEGFALGSNWIVEGAFRVLSDGSGTVVDVSMGVANATHASDADSITESCFIHLDANSTNIYAESDDGTTEVAATDTTIDYTEGTAKANQVEFWMDGRNPADVQIYVNGSLVLGSTVFNLNVATGPLFPLVHVEKSSSTDTYKLAVDWLRVRTAEQ
jgi:hypothetical protein